MNKVLSKRIPREFRSNLPKYITAASDSALYVSGDSNGGKLGNNHYQNS